MKIEKVSEQDLESIFTSPCILSAYAENKWVKKGAGEATLLRSAQGEVKLDMLETKTGKNLLHRTTIN